MKLSIIVPMYNVANYLAKCLDSLLEQDLSHSDYEIILVNDGSTDKCGEIAQQYADTYTNVKLISQKNMGLSVARNVGIKQAQGDYILFVDSDDYLQPNCLGSLIAQAESNELDVLRFRYQNVRENGEIFVPHEGMMTDYNDYSSIPTDGLTFLNERMWVQCYACQFIVKAEIAKQELFTPNIYFEDTDWTPRMLLRAKRVASVDSIVYNYLWREGSITLSQKNVVKQRKQLCDKICLLQKLNEWGSKQKNRKWFDAMISGLVINIVGMLSANFYAERKEYIRKIKDLNILPITTYHVAQKAHKKVKLINWSIDLATMLLHITRKR